MPSPEPLLSRRALLAAAPLLAAAACTGGSRTESATGTSSAGPAPSPGGSALGTPADADRLRAAVEAELQILAEYPRTIHPESVAGARATHLEHLRALGGTPASPAPLSRGPLAGPGSLRRHLAASGRDLRTAAAAADDGAVAALLASVGAAHAATAAEATS